jgi:hypothetical protein
MRTRTLNGLLGALGILAGCAGTPAEPTESQNESGAAADRIDDGISRSARRMLAEGRATFRSDTFGDEAFWSGQLQLHQAINGEARGGVGAGVSPRTALAVGLKVDVEALPRKLVEHLKAGRVNLNDPAITIELIRLDAVVGLRGKVRAGRLESLGITCAFCHSTVDDSFAPGIGHRLDGWANRDLDVGTIVSLAPNLKPVTDHLGVDEATLRQVLAGWGPGKFDAEVFLDGKGFRPDGGSAATLIPAAYGLAGVNLHTYTGWGSVTYWNAFVANLEMHGQGTFFDPRLDDASRFPIAAEKRLGHIASQPDLITGKLAALHFYQLAIPAPTPPEGSFDPEAAERGDELFEGKARCSGCHVEPLYTEPGWNLHTAEEIGIDDFQAQRSPEVRYRTTPLKGLWAHQKGGFYHDGRFADLAAVVDHYDRHFGLQLTAQEQADLVEYLKSI